MTTANDLVLQELGDEPQDRSAIALATGLELSAVSTALTALKSRGLAARADGGGWVAGEGAPSTTHTHAAKNPEAKPPRELAKQTVKQAKRRRARGDKQENPEPANKRGRKCGRPRKEAKQATVSPRRVNGVSHGRMTEFAITESGSVLFKIKHGSRAGEMGEIGAADAAALYALMDRVMRKTT